MPSIAVLRRTSFYAGHYPRIVGEATEHTPDGCD